MEKEKMQEAISQVDFVVPVMRGSSKRPDMERVGSCTFSEDGSKRLKYEGMKIVNSNTRDDISTKTSYEAIPEFPFLLHVTKKSLCRDFKVVETRKDTILTSEIIAPGRVKRERNSATVALLELFSNLLEKIRMDTGSHTAVCLTSSKKNHSLSAVYIYPTESMNARTLVVVHRTPTSNSSHEGEDFCLRIHGCPTSFNELDMQCNCQYEMKNSTCIHQTIIWENLELRQNLFALFTIPCVVKKHYAGYRAIELKETVMNGEKLWVSYSKTDSKPLSAYTVVVRQLRRRGISGKDVLHCTACRRDYEKRGYCVHEISVVSSKKVLESAISIHGDAICSHHVYESPSSTGEHRANFVNAQVNTDDNPGCSKNFCSTEARSLFRCPSDENSLLDIYKTLEKSVRSFSNETSCMVFQDKGRACRKCGKPLYDENHAKGARREVLLHTFSQGTVRALVEDRTCHICGTFHRFDGRKSAVFSATETQVYTREVLDFFVHEVCGGGKSFREAYSTFMVLSSSPSYAIQCKGIPLSVNRRACSSAFYQFLSLLQLPTENVMKKMFFCPTCEIVLADGSRFIESVVLDGTAVGVLNQLPKYNRDTYHLPRFYDKKHTSVLIRNKTARSLMVDMWISASRAKENWFTLQSRFKLEKLGDMRLIVPGEEGDNRKQFQNAQFDACKSFLSACFERLACPLSLVIDSSPRCKYEKKADLKVAGSAPISFKHKLPIEVRLATSDFGRCFLAHPLMSGVMRNRASHTACVKMREVLREMLSFQSTNANSNGLDFATILIDTSKQLRNSLPCGAYLLESLAKLSHELFKSNLRELLLATDKVLSVSVAGRENYLSHFEKGAPPATLQYQKIHERGELYIGRKYDSWIHEAQETGEFFPGRQLVRPRVSFGSNGDREDLKTCEKNYQHAKSHTPGLFTVTCTCSYPKILGVSVMEDTEGISTAFSVLLSRFKNLPVITYYDNACNATASASVRLPWLHDHTFLLVDRFHYKSHKCSSVHDANAYRFSDFNYTSSAESLNRVWSQSKAHIRFLNSNNLMPFIAIRTIFVNMKAVYRQTNMKHDVDYFDIHKFARELIDCQCIECENKSTFQKAQ